MKNLNYEDEYDLAEIEKKLYSTTIVKTRRKESPEAILANKAELMFSRLGV